LRIAEGGEIRRQMQFLESEEAQRQQEEAAEILVHAEQWQPGGLLQKIANPKILAECIQRLELLKCSVTAHGFKNSDRKILQSLYGTQLQLGIPLRDLHQILWNLDSTDPGAADAREVPTEHEREFLLCLNEELARLKRVEQYRARSEHKRLQIESLRRSVPDAHHSDHFLRYETTLERAFDRTLSQLERVQQTRRGQPVSPRIELEVK
jgi:hypothetical protein